jgi:uncharacterized protein (DUF697 family)
MTDNAEQVESGWIGQHLEQTLRAALMRAYDKARVHPDAFLAQLNRAHGMELQSYDELFRVPLEELDSIAQRTMRGAMKMAGVGGAGLGLGGMATLLPDMGALAVITMRMVQKLSLVYGFEFNTEEEMAELWIAAATAAGVDVGRDLLEKTVVKNLIERLAARMAERISAEAAEKLVARAVPVVSSVFGAVLNYYFVRAWGKRALGHFRERHLLERERRARPGSPPAERLQPGIAG